jgi:glycosyltransferase involved in cell wall biosynthesis
MLKSNNQQKVYILIPAYNEEKVICDVILEVKKAGYENILVVDDGSQDETFKKAKSMEGVITLKHFINRGKGAAIKTGIEAAKILGAETVVTIDGDGQHDPKDIEKMLELIKNNFDVVLGTRLQNPKGMPWYKILANYIGNGFTWMIYGLYVTDSQSGFRAYSKRALSLIETKTDRYEYDSEVIREISKHKLKYAEISIKVRYTEYSMSKKNKQGLINGFKTLAKMIINQ